MADVGKAALQLDKAIRALRATQSDLRGIYTPERNVKTWAIEHLADAIRSAKRWVTDLAALKRQDSKKLTKQKSKQRAQRVRHAEAPTGEATAPAQAPVTSGEMEGVVQSSAPPLPPEPTTV
jgi:hypothetical protein